MQPIKIIKLNSSTFKLENASSTVIEKLREKFSFLPKGYMFNPKFRLMGYKAIKVQMVKTDGSFPSGLFFEVFDYLENSLGKNVVFSKDVSKHFKPFKIDIKEDIFKEKGFVFRDYQIKAIKKALKYRYGLLNLSTGAGKCLKGDTKIKVKLPIDIIKKYNLIHRCKNQN